jgi:hypothetical protein
MNDPFYLFKDLPDYPGKTAPRNRKAAIKQVVTNDDLNGAKHKVYRINGVDRVFYTVGELARALSRKPVTVRMWEQRGWIPKVKYRTRPPANAQLPGKPSKGRRLYSDAQVHFLVAAVDKYRLDDPRKADWDGFRGHVKDNWPAD